MDDQMNLGRANEDELPEHETRPERDTGAGLTQSGVSVEQRGPVDRDALEAQNDDEPWMKPEEAPPAYRPRSG